MSLYGQAFSAAPRATQETLVALQESWAAVAAALDSGPPREAALDPGQDAAAASAALDAWDAWATARGNAPTIATIIGRNPSAIAPGWGAIETRAAARSPALGEAVSALRGAYQVATADTVLRGLGADDRAGLWWLDERLRAAPQPAPPESDDVPWGKLLAGAFLVYLASRGGRRR